MNKMPIRSVLALITALPLGTGSLRAQAAPGTETASASQEEAVALSPFVVTAEEDAGSYQATATLAGSRIRTDLKDVASSISVITSEFLKNTGAVNNQTLLQYTTNTEVGGIYGNYTGVGGTFIEGATESAANLLRPSTNTRVRGLDSADNTRDFFQTDIPWDSFNVGRVDLQRGPNSILFGIGSPAGIINTSVNTAGYKTEGHVENRIGSFGTVRDSIDFNYVVIPDQLAVRIAGVYDDTKYRQQPAYNWDRRLFGAIRWDPKFFKNGRTTVRANYEKGTVRANRPRTLPPIDRITPFFGADQINKQFVDGYYVTTMGIAPFSSSSLETGMTANFWLSGNQGPGLALGSNPVFYYDNSSSPMSARAGSVSGWFTIDANGQMGGHQLGGYPYGSSIGIASYNEWANNLAQYGATHGATAEQVASVAGAQSGFYKSKSLTDPSIFDFYNNLIDGPTKKEWQGWESYNVSLEQTFFDDRVGFQAVYDRQHYDDGMEANLGYSTYLSVDILQNTMFYPWAYTDLVQTNPNAGRVFVGSSAKNGANNSRTTDRENLRFTAFGELRAKDFLGNSLLSRIIGHHTITGLYNEERYDVEDRNWVRYAVTNSWSDLVGRGYIDGDGTGGIRGGSTVLDNITYLTGSVVGSPSASGLNIPRIMNEQSPSGTYTVQYFDSHWKWPLDPSASGYVDPAAPWNDPTTRPESNPLEVQANNPANMVGVTNTTVTVLNADRGDINSLYTDGSKTQRKTTSEGFTWQAYLWDDIVVGTVGWRRDKQKQRAGYASTDRYGVASMDYRLNPLDPTGVTTGTSTSWGIVIHTPHALREKLPWGTDISLAYSDGRNTRVENRYGFDASILPNAKGHTRDWSLVISTLKDRLTLKATYYKTIVKDANLSSVTTATSTLGNNTSELRDLEAWGTASALMNLAGMQGQFSGWEWYWNWALIAHNWDSAYNDPNGALFLNDPATASEKAATASWLSQMQPQSWFDAFGYQIDVAKAQAGDWAHAIQNGSWQPATYVGAAASTPGAGRINGAWPTGTVDYESKGWEFEITGQPLKNWNVSVNASKQMAQQVALGAKLVEFIEAAHAKYESPAGDLRLWWGGDNNLRFVFNRDVYSAYLFQKETNGKMVAEMAPWRVNLITNYTFDRGLLKGVNVGGGYRWQDGIILGYALNEAQNNLDVNKPYWAPSQRWVDLWVGYQTKIRGKVNWHIQLNLRNVGQKPHLTPISVQPDGTLAQYRIEEGLTWTLTNTFSF